MEQEKGKEEINSLCTRGSLGAAVKAAIDKVQGLLEQDPMDVKTLRELTGMLKELAALVLSLEKTERSEEPEREALQVVFRAGEESWNN